MQESFDKIYAYLIQYGMNFLAAILIFIIGKWAARFASRILEGALSRSKLEKTLIVFFRNIAYYTILTFVAIAALNKIGIETSSFLAIIGAAGLAVGLALQGALSNFAAGVMIIIFHPFRLGDYVEAGGGEGTVSEIQIFSTILINRDNKRIIIPNAKLTGDKIVVHPRPDA